MKINTEKLFLRDVKGSKLKMEENLKVLAQQAKRQEEIREEIRESYFSGKNQKSKQHEIARILFGKGMCEICGLTRQESISKHNQILSTHCTSVPKDYNLIKFYNWMTLCIKCHCETEANLKLGVTHTRTYKKYVKILNEKISMKDVESKRPKKELSSEDIMEKIEQDRDDYYQIDYRKVVKNLSIEDLSKE